MNKYILILIVLFLSSCTLYKEFPIDIYKPGEIALSPSVKNIAIISRNFKYKNDTLQHYYKEDTKLLKDKINEGLNIDSIAALRAIQGLTRVLKTNESFENIQLFPINTIKPHSGDKLLEYKKSFIDDISSSAKADILISLESTSYFFSKWNASVIGAPQRNEVITINIWSIYDPLTLKHVDRKSMIDTVYWDGYDENLNRIKSKPPPRIEAIKLSSELAGENYAKHFTPYWQKVNRMYIIPPVEDFKIGAQYFEDGKWNSAIDVWRIYTSGKFGKLAISARYNTALAYEMKDEIETAVSWINKAAAQATALKSKSDIEMVELYKKVLTNRLIELEKLN